MPILHADAFKPPIIQINGQLQTLVPGIFRKPEVQPYERERLELEDGDFLDLDWIKNDRRRLIILTHGLEGNSSRHYIKGMAAAFSQQGWDVLAWNCRSCSGELNRLPKLYHHGEIGDLSLVIAHTLRIGGYAKIWLGGFSMGANISMNYLSKMKEGIPDEVKGAVVCSAPVDLEDGVRQLESRAGKFYRWRFFKMLSEKLILKEKQFPGWIDVNKFKEVRHWAEFDRWFSAPINGFKDELDFYYNASPIHFLEDLQHPVLLVNAKNDLLLGIHCYPAQLAKSHAYLHYMEPVLGGHVGFAQRQHISWFEQRALEFTEQFA